MPACHFGLKFVHPALCLANLLHDVFRLFIQFVDQVGFQRRCGPAQNTVLMRDIRQHALARYRFNPPRTCRNARFGQQLEKPCLRRVGKVRTAAEFDGIAAHGNNAHDLAVFLSKLCGCPQLFRLVDRKLLHNDRQRG